MSDLSNEGLFVTYRTRKSAMELLCYSLEFIPETFCSFGVFCVFTYHITGT